VVRREGGLSGTSSTSGTRHQSPSAHPTTAHGGARETNIYLECTEQTGGASSRDRKLLGRKAYVGEKVVGAVNDFYLGRTGAGVTGVVVWTGVFKSRPFPKGSFDFDGERFLIDPGAAGSAWKPEKQAVTKYSRVREKEVFAGPGWKIGRLKHLGIDTNDWLVSELLVDVEHALMMRDVGEYSKLKEETGVYGFNHFYKDAYSFNPGKIVSEMEDSDKARFLSDSGDSNIRGMGEATSEVTLPPDGMRIHESGTITLPIDAARIQAIAVRMVNDGVLKTDEGRRNIVRDVFREYYESADQGQAT
jgi:sporulation protein YlmC with PRC-barrel domain